jgi:hypothetical protein
MGSLQKEELIRARSVETLGFVVAILATAVKTGFGMVVKERW